MFDYTLLLVASLLAAVISMSIVGFFLRYVYGHIESRVVAHMILIILGAFGVFLTIFALLASPTYFFYVLVSTVPYSLIFVLIVTSGLNKNEKSRKKLSRVMLLG